MTFDFRSCPPAFMPPPVAIPPPRVPLVGDTLFPTLVPIAPFVVAPATAARIVDGGMSEPPAAKLAVKTAGAMTIEVASAIIGIFIGLPFSRDGNFRVQETLCG